MELTLKMELSNIPEALALPLRLSLLSFLVNGEKTFSEMKSLTGASDGNISVQLKKLESWGYLIHEKRFTLTKTITYYAITDFGLNSLEEYVSLLEKILKHSN